MEIETLRVKGWAKDDSHKDGVLINKSDFDPEVHTLFDAPDGPVNEFLSRTAQKIIEDLPLLTDEELSAILADEKTGKDRAGVVTAIEKEIAARAQ